ncbi:MAG: tripartite tricarboxylate transporter substrate binding protein [Rhodospirillaceae bacterium]
MALQQGAAHGDTGVAACAKKSVMLRSALVVAAAVMPWAHASAQHYPSKPIRFIVPYPAGGGVDMLARVVAPRLSERLGQQVVIDNRGGAGGNIGTELAARAVPDGYTLMMGAAALAINVTLYPKLPFDPVRDFAPVSLLASTPNLVAVHPSVPARSITELIHMARSASPRINFASAGNGTTSHLAGVLLASMAKLKLVHVPYKGTTPAVVALLSGEVPLMLAPALTILPHVHTGKLRALAITSAARSQALPDLPTVAESGVAGYEASQWYGVLVPTGTADGIVSRLNREIVAIMRLPDVSERLTREGSLPVGDTPQHFAQYLNSEITKWSAVIKASGATVD